MMQMQEGHNSDSSPPKPIALRVHLAAIPQALKDLDQWVLWRYEYRNGSWTKVPYSARGHKARSNDPSTWSSFDRIAIIYDGCDGAYDGIGLCLCQGDGLVGIDIDHCVDSDGCPNPQAVQVAVQCETYMERSPGGDGLRLFGYGNAHRCGKNTGSPKWLEIYDHGSPRYLTVTGHATTPPIIQHIQAGLDWLHETHMKAAIPISLPPKKNERAGGDRVSINIDDQQVLTRARSSRTGHEFIRLFDNGDVGAQKNDGTPDKSAGDLALCNILAFWCNRDASQMDRLFRASALMRDKWDAQRGSHTYGEMTIAKASADCRETYNPTQAKHTTDPVAQLAQLPQDPRKPLAKADPEKKQGGKPDFNNWRNFRSIFEMAGTEVDTIPILPERPDAGEWPNTPLDPLIAAIQDRTQAPWVLCAQSTLAAITLAVQHLADVAIPGIGGDSARRPISNFFITIARSGERKSSVDRIALEGVDGYVAKLTERWENEYAVHKNRMWEFAQRERRLRAAGSYDELGEPPDAPMEPIALIKEPTQEGLFRALAKGQFSQGLFNDEGGAFIGGYGMSRDHRMRTAATFNSLWDGKPLDRPRAKEHEAIRGRRFAVHLMVQPKASAELTGDAMMADVGLLARCLVAEPPSAIGTRLFKEPSAKSIAICDSFSAYIESRMALAGQINESGLAPRVLPLSDESRERWIKFHDEVEQQLGSNYATVQGFASKAPEHAVRLACVLAMFADADAADIHISWMQMGIELAKFYINQHLRLAVPRANDEEESAQLLLEWLHTKWTEPAISVADICRRGPSPLRKRSAAIRAVEIAAETGHLRPLQGSHTIGGVTRRQCFSICAKSDCESCAS